MEHFTVLTTQLGMRVAWRERVTAAIAVAMSCVVSVPAARAQADTYETAVNLGSMLASETPCGLTYDQAAIQAFIGDNVPPSEMGFADQLASMTRLAASSLEGVSGSKLTAHCSAIAASAAHFGFVEAASE